MKVTITIEDASQADRDEMNRMFLAFKSMDLISIEKLENGVQKWTLSCAGITRAIMVNIKYIVNNTVNDKLTVNPSTSIENGTSTVEGRGGRETSSHSPKIVNDNNQVPMELLPIRLVIKQEVKDFIAFWNEHIWLPKIRGTDRQCREIRIALSRPLFAQCYKEGVAEIAKSKFLRGGISHRGDRFHMTLDWFLNPDNFDKIIEGKYRDTEEPEQHHEKRFDKETL